MGWFDDITDTVSDTWDEVKDPLLGVSTFGSYTALDRSGATDYAGGALGITKSAAEKAAEENKKRAELLTAPNFFDPTNPNQGYRSVGELGPSAYNSITEDPATRGAQMSALSKLQEIYNAKGLTDADKAQLAQIATQEAMQEKGQREAITQNAQARGTAGSGLEQAQLLGAQQGTATRASSRDLQVQRDAQARALNALSQSANLGGDIRRQDYGIASDKANAADLISRFNFGNQQNIADLNAGRTDQYTQQGFNNNLALYNAQTGQNTAVAQAKDDRYAKGADAAGKAIEGIAKAYGA